MTRNNPLDSLDPAVASLLGDAERKQQIRHLPKNKRERARRQAERPRVMLDIHPDVQEAVARIAEAEGLSVSAVVTLLLADGIRRYNNGGVNFSATKRISRSPRYEWALRDRVVEDVLTGKISLTENRGDLWK